jgi:ubiquinone biosynthesis protein
MKLTSLPQYTRNAKRFTEIVSILVKYGFANFIRKNDPEFIKGLFKSAEGVTLSDLSAEARIRMALTELGTTFIKLGQILSTRPDLVGPSLSKELSELQAEVPADPPEVVQHILESELGASPQDLFKSFAYEPLASASIGQVHGATLKNGEAVVVKVQHPGIEKNVTTDLEILMTLADIAENHDRDMRLYRPRAMVQEIRKRLLRELDFRREGRNLEEFARNFEGDSAVHIPRFHPELTTYRVLTMERLEGFSIADMARVEEENLDTKILAEKIARVFLDMIFRDSFYHADPHPGNIWVLSNGVIGLLDCGMVGRLDMEAQEDIEGMVWAGIGKDVTRLSEYVIRIGSIPQGFDRDALRADLGDFVAEYVGQSLKDFNLSSAMNSLVEIIRRHRIVLPAGISSLIKVLVMLEGTTRSLNRDFSLAELLQPYYEKTMHRRFSPDRLFRRLQRSYRDWDRFIDMLPRELADILQRVRDGKFDVHLEHRRLEATANRLVYGLLTAAFFVGSCQLLSLQVPPTIGGVSLLGSIGLLFTCMFGLRLVRAVKKSGGLSNKE